MTAQKPYTEILVAVDAPHFYAGIVLRDDVVIDAAPILRWTLGKRREMLRDYFAQKGWRTRIIIIQK
jgi:hypothetical protein